MAAVGRGTHKKEQNGSFSIEVIEEGTFKYMRAWLFY
jgi:hypothetical protein